MLGWYGMTEEWTSGADGLKERRGERNSEDGNGTPREAKRNDVCQFFFSIRSNYLCNRAHPCLRRAQTSASEWKAHVQRTRTYIGRTRTKDAHVHTTQTCKRLTQLFPKHYLCDGKVWCGIEQIFRTPSSAIQRLLTEKLHSKYLSDIDSCSGIWTQQIPVNEQFLFKVYF